MNPAYSKNPQTTQKIGLSRLLKNFRLSASPGAVIGLILMCVVVLLVSIGTKTSSDTALILAKERPREIAEETPATAPATTETETKLATITIYVSGAVLSPGVYELSPQSRLQDAITKAHGLAENADANIINLAQLLFDGQHIHVPAKGEPPLSQTDNATSEGAHINACVNLKTASLTELTSLDGIGEKTAQRILDYRNTRGINQPQDLLNIDGIGQKTYHRIESGICK